MQFVKRQINVGNIHKSSTIMCLRPHVQVLEYSYATVKFIPSTVGRIVILKTWFRSVSTFVEYKRVPTRTV